jgi:hypothetical protein
LLIGSDDLLDSFLPNISLDSPSREDMTLLEDLLDFLECSPGRFGKTKEDVDACGKVECGEYEICL